MTIAFDIDGTWTLDPLLFVRAACLFSESGWTVIIVTGREQPLDKLQRLRLAGPVCSFWPVIVSGTLLKSEAANNAGYTVDVWVDDMPGMIEQTRILKGEL